MLQDKVTDVQKARAYAGLIYITDEKVTTKYQLKSILAIVIMVPIWSNGRGPIMAFHPFPKVQVLREYRS